MVPWNGDVGGISVSGIKCGEVETGPLTVPNNHKSSFVRKVLRWSSNDVMRACSLAGNCGLAEQLMQQIIFFIICINLDCNRHPTHLMVLLDQLSQREVSVLAWKY
uniref:Uncharacterized protein n=1 Tax=Cucumis sativus TaxID=3659 RepID=A0A0A0K9F7_CUCSA